MKNLKIIFFGTPNFVIPVLETLHDNFNLVGVVTAPPQPAGRKKTLTASPVATFLEGSKWPLKRLEPSRLDPETISEVGELKPDLLVVASYGKIIPQSLLDVAQHGAINIHPSLLPKYRGASPIQSAILNGDKVSGITLIKMDEKMDHGPIVYQEDFPLSQLDTFDSLSKKMFLRSAEILSGVIKDYISGKTKPRVQNHAKASFCNMIKKEDGYFDIEYLPTPERLDKMIRAYYPWPTAWTTWRTKNQESRIKFLPNNMIQLGGKKPTPLKDFLNGHPDFPLRHLLKP